jgi:hypothetical protein
VLMQVGKACRWHYESPETYAAAPHARIAPVTAPSNSLGGGRRRCDERVRSCVSLFERLAASAYL